MGGSASDNLVPLGGGAYNDNHESFPFGRKALLARAPSDPPPGRPGALSLAAPGHRPDSPASGDDTVQARTTPATAAPLTPGPEGIASLGRREFLQRAAVASALFGVPLARAEEAFAQEAPPLPPRTLYATDRARYWAELRRQWLLAADRINLNSGALGCTPVPVLRATIDHLLYAESFREPGLPWFGYEENTHIRSARDALASFLHCRRDELALTRNCTEGLNIVCNGLDLRAGDEVLMTDQEHPGGRCPWEQKAARFGVKLKFVKLPRPPGCS
jgi:hypothetical protein